MLKKVETEHAPKAIGPYSQAIVAQGAKMVFVSGQIPIDTQSGQVEAVGIKEQSKVVLKNLLAILKEAGVSQNYVAKTTVYLKNMGDFADMNQEYEKVFAEHKPARVCLEVARLPRDVLVEIDAIAVI
jgi:2-iminobutanoate/2-iminopropanoate deaminase